MTYDYRDFGESQICHPRDSKAIFTDWAVYDQSAAQAKLAALAPEGPLWVLGHSLGGLGIPFHGYTSRTARIITVGAGLGHYTDHPWSYMPKVIAFWFLLGPIATALAGYMSGKRLLLGADLPAGVYWQWRRWCTQRGFFNSDVGKCLPVPNYAINVPIVRIAVAADDVVVPPAAVKRYAEALSPSNAEYTQYNPADYGLLSLKHIEFLKKGSDAVWADLLSLNQSDDTKLLFQDQTLIR